MNRHSERYSAAERILDAIGELDDRTVAQCARPYVKQVRKRSFKAIVILAAVLTITASLFVGAFVVGMLGIRKDVFESENDEASTAVNTQSQAENTYGLTLAERLYKLKDSYSDTTYTADQIDLHDGSIRIVWKYANEDGYRVCSISTKELSSLERELEIKYATPVQSHSSSTLEGIWLCRADGTVISPCLKPSEGNVGYGELFDYDPELEPPSSFTYRLFIILEGHIESTAESEQ